MNLWSFLLLLLIAFIAGSLGASIAQRKGLGCLAYIALGFIGAMLGAYLQQKFELPEPLLLRIGSRNFPLVLSILTSAVFVAVISGLSKKK